MPGQPPPHPPGRPARIPILVAAGTPLQRNVAEVDTRTLAVQAMDQALRNAAAIEEMSASRAVTLAPPAPAAEGQPAAPEGLPPMRPPASSVHEWSPMLAEADRILAERMRDPKDRMDSMRARAIAKEVVEGVKTAEDAASFRGLKQGSKKLLFQALSLLVAAGVGAAIAGFGSCFHGGH